MRPALESLSVTRAAQYSCPASLGSPPTSRLPEPESLLLSYFPTIILWKPMDSKETKEKERFSIDGKAPSEDNVEPEAAANSVHDEEAAIGNGRYRGLGTKANPYVVEWDIGDTEEPYNWPKSRKWPLTMLVRIDPSSKALTS